MLLLVHHSLPRRGLSCCLRFLDRLTIDKPRVALAAITFKLPITPPTIGRLLVLPATATLAVILHAWAGPMFANTAGDSF